MDSVRVIIATPVDRLSLGVRLDTHDDAITGVDFMWAGDVRPGPSPPDPVVAELHHAFDRYFLRADVHAFHMLNVRLGGTSFQHRVWEALRAIPCGEVVTYGDLARRLNSSARAVGGACRANPIPVIVPCHRVVATRDVGGFAGQRSGDLVNLKEWLLRHERRRRIDFSGQPDIA